MRNRIGGTACWRWLSRPAFICGTVTSAVGRAAGATVCDEVLGDGVLDDGAELGASVTPEQLTNPATTANAATRAPNPLVAAFIC